MHGWHTMKGIDSIMKLSCINAFSLQKLELSNLYCWTGVFIDQSKRNIEDSIVFLVQF